MYIKIIKSDEHPVVFERLVNNFINQPDIIVRDIKYVIRPIENYVAREAMIIYHMESDFTGEEKSADDKNRN